MKSYSYDSYLSNKRKTIFALLEQNPLLTAKSMAKLLSIPLAEWNKEKNYLKKLKNDWKCHHPKEQGSIRCFPDGVHNVFYKGVLPVGIVEDVRSKALPFGWRVSASKNRFWLFKNMLGRVRFFGTGTVELFVRKPANLGKCMQLFSDAFTRNYLITDIRVVDQFKAELMRRCHATYKTGQRLPYMKVTTYVDTHRLTFVSGDRTHPDCYEFILEYHAEVEQARRLFEELRLSFGSNGNGGVSPLKQDYSR